MTILTFFRDLYSLDTLDTRLTTSSKTSTNDASNASVKTTIRDTSSNKSLPQGASPSKWNTLEFYFYGFVFVTIVPLMYKAVWDVSQPSSSHYVEYEKLLSDGWLFGRKVDNSDDQYSGFRDNLPALSLLLIFHPLLRRLYDSVFSSGQASSPQKSNLDAGTRIGTLASRVGFDFVSGIVFISALHGFSALKILTILYINYCIALRLPREYIPTATWVFNVGILFANELARGYRFTSMAEAAAPFYAGASDAGKFLDGWGGLIPRWEVHFNITILRLIAFNMDCYWSLARDRAGSPLEVGLPISYPLLCIC